MLAKQLRVALRGFWNRPLYAAVNLIGLSLGLALCLVLFLFVRYEFSFDDFFPASERTYRVTTERTLAGQTTHFANAPRPLADRLRREIRGVQKATAFSRFWTTEISVEDRHYYNDKVLLVDSSFFEVFPLRMEYGNRNGSLVEPGTVVLTADAAQQFFGGETNPVGRVIELSGHGELRVTGVLESLPENTHLEFDLLVHPGSGGGDWFGVSHWTYVVLSETVTRSEVGNAITHQKGSWIGGARAKDLSFQLQPLTDIHLHSNLEQELGRTGSATYVYALMLVGLLILLIACFNYINLSTARFSARARNVGVQKVLGAHRSQLAWRYIVETLLFTSLAGGLALGVAYLLRPVLAHLAGQPIPFRILDLHIAIPAFLATILITGLLAGSYPAFVVSGVNPIRALKHDIGGAGRDVVRKGLVVAQFVVAVGLIAGTFLVRNQVSFLTSTDLGFDQDQVLVVRDFGFSLQGRTTAFENELERHPAVERVSGGSIPGESHGGTYVWTPRGESRLVHRLHGGYEYVETLGLELARGRSFSPEHPADSSGLILNQKAVEVLGLEEPIGARLDDQGIEGRVIGVVKDFHLLSLRHAIPPLYIQFSPEASRTFLVRIRPERTDEALTHLDAVWSSLAGDRPLSYTFLDQRFAQFYSDQRRLADIFWAFSAVAVLLAVLGLFALAAFMAERRQKEIGIRKVLGATSERIVAMICGEFVRLVLVAILISLPLTMVLVNEWLEQFAYHASGTLGYLGLSVLLSVGIAVLTVGLQSLRAAYLNPATAIRDQ